MRITLGNLKRLIKEEQLRLPFPSLDLDQVAKQGRKIRDKIERTAGDRDPLYRERSTLIDQMRNMMNDLYSQRREARKVGDRERMNSIDANIDRLTHVASIDIMGYSEPTFDVWATAQQVHGGDPGRSRGLGS